MAERKHGLTEAAPYKNSSPHTHTHTHKRSCGQPYTSIDVTVSMHIKLSSETSFFFGLVNTAACLMLIIPSVTVKLHPTARMWASTWLTTQLKFHIQESLVDLLSLTCLIMCKTIYLPVSCLFYFSSFHCQISSISWLGNVTQEGGSILGAFDMQISLVMWVNVPVDRIN